ncbi:YwqI/YxiC family protein [Bacillus sp. P14.5]|uniref:YwqI/YxiC family protein n=1 Tax=Bacillus sp. P14.5 TaxID=1983400 RepID=UPI0013B04B73|nr:YwqI/YxiC family protein [Bacillus sp. P14.5]
MVLEIKIHSKETDSALTTLRQTVDAWNTSYPRQVGGENALEVINKLNDLNEQCQSMLESYKQLLLENQAAAQQSVETMEETDRSLSSMITSGR